MKCTKCGNDLDALTTFCGQCGTKVEPVADDDRTVVITPPSEPESLPEPPPAPAVAAAPVPPAPAPVEAAAPPAPAPAPAPVPTPTPAPPPVPAPVPAEAPSVTPPVAVAPPEDPSLIDKCKALFKEKPAIAFGGLAGAVVLLVAIILAATLGGTHNPPYEVIQMGRYDDILYIGNGQFVVMRGSGANARWGVQNTRGRDIIEFGRFDMPNDESFVAHDGNFVVQRGRTFYILNSNGSEITSFDRYDRISYVSPNRFIVGTGIGGNVRTGLVDRRGNYIIPMGQYDRLQPIENGDRFIAWDGSRKGILDARGNVIISLGRYDHIQPVPGSRYIVQEGTRVALLDNRAREIIRPGLYDRIFPAGDSHFIVQDGNRWGVVDARAREVIPFRYDSISFTGTHFIVNEGDRFGALDMRGNEVIRFGQYDRVMYALNSRFLVGRGQSWEEDSVIGVVDARGNEIIPMGRFNLIEPVPGDRFVVGTGEFNDWWGSWEIDRRGVVDHRGNEIIDMGRFDRVEFFRSWWGNAIGVEADPVFVVQTGDRMGVLGLDGQEIIPSGAYASFYGMYNRLAIVADNRDSIGVINTRRSR